MAVSHVFSNAVADATGTLTIWFGATTATVAATDIVRPTDWNSAHNQYLTISGNTAGQSTISGTNIVLAGGNNVTLSANGSTVSIAAAAGGGGGVALSAGANSVSNGTVVFSNSNGVTFGLNGSTVTASHNGLTQQSTQPVAASAANGSAAFSTLSFSNANGISFSTGAGPSIVASHNALTSQSNQAFSAPGGSSAFQTLVFANSNGVSFSNSNGSVVATVQTNYAASNHSHGNPTLALTNLSGTTASNSNGLTLSLSAAAPGAGAGFTGGVSNLGNTSGDTGTQTGSIIFAGGNNITLSVATAAGGHQTITISGANAGGAQTGISGVALSNTTYTSGTVSFRDLNGITWQSTTGQALQITHDLQYTSATSAITSNALNTSASRVINIIAATNNTGGGTASLSSNVSFSNANGITFYTSAGNAVIASHNALTSQSNQAFSAGAASSTFQTLSFQDSNGISFSNNAGAIRATYTRNVASNAIQPVGSATGSGTNTSRFAADDHVHAGVFSMGVSNDAGNTAGDTRVDVGRFVLRGGNNITLSQITAANALNTIVVSAGAGGGVTPVASASNGSFSFTTLAFSNANNVTFGTSAGSIITASVAAPGAAAENNAINLLGANTAGNTTATGSTIGWSGINLTLSGTNNSQVVVSAPATSSIVGTSGISISSAGSTISVMRAAFSRLIIGEQISQAANAQLNSVVSIRSFKVDEPLVFSRANIGASVTVASAANNSSAFFDASASLVLYTRNVSTLSSINSGSASFTQTWASNATGSITGPQYFTINMGAITLQPGEYWMAAHFSTTNTATGGAATTALGNTVSMIVGQVVGSAAMGMRNFAVGTNSSQAAHLGVGAISTGATRASIAFSEITQTGTRAAAAMLHAQLANYTVF